MDQSNASSTVLLTASYFQKREKCISYNFQRRRLTTKFCEFPLITGRNEVGPRVIFSQACVKNSVHRGGVSVSVHAGIHPPRSRHPTPGKQTAAYGQRAAGTHPTGMHSCMIMCLPTCACSSFFCFRLLRFLLQPNQMTKACLFLQFLRNENNVCCFLFFVCPCPPFLK